MFCFGIFAGWAVLAPGSHVFNTSARVPPSAPGAGCEFQQKLTNVEIDTIQKQTKYFLQNQMKHFTEFTAVVAGGCRINSICWETFSLENKISCRDKSHLVLGWASDNSQVCFVAFTSVTPVFFSHLKYLFKVGNNWCGAVVELQLVYPGSWTQK